MWQKGLLRVKQITFKRTQLSDCVLLFNRSRVCKLDPLQECVPLVRADRKDQHIEQNSVVHKSDFPVKSTELITVTHYLVGWWENFVKKANFSFKITGRPVLKNGKRPKTLQIWMPSAGWSSSSVKRAKVKQENSVEIDNWKSRVLTINIRHLQESEGHTLQNQSISDNFFLSKHKCWLVDLQRICLGGLGWSGGTVKTS